MVARPAARRKVARLPRQYVLGCGGLFVVYTVCLYGAIGLAGGREQVLEVGVINYLWPGLTLVLSVPILHKRAGLGLILGAVLGFAGVVLAAWPAGAPDGPGLAGHLRANAWPFLLALVGAVTWALYSNLSRRWAERAEGQAVPLFLLATGAVMAGLRVALGGASQWSPGVLAPLLFLAAHQPEERPRL